MDNTFTEINFHLTNKNEEAVICATLDNDSDHVCPNTVLHIHIKKRRTVLSFPFFSKQGAVTGLYSIWTI
jgi:hypothetical protein